MEDLQLGGSQRGAELNGMLWAVSGTPSWGLEDFGGDLPLGAIAWYVETETQNGTLVNGNTD